MLISVPNTLNFRNCMEGDLIAITREYKFIGYASIYSKLSDTVILDADKKIWNLFNELIGENIPFDFNVE